MRNGDNLTTFIVPKVMKIRNLNPPDPQRPVQACSGKTLLNYYKMLRGVIKSGLRTDPGSKQGCYRTTTNPQGWESFDVKFTHCQG